MATRSYDRWNISEDMKVLLEDIFRNNRYPDTAFRDELAHDLDTTETRIRVSRIQDTMTIISTNT